MWERLRRFRALARPAKALFLRAVFLLPILTISLRLSGFQKTKRRLQVARAGQSLNADAEDTATRISLTTRMVLAAARHSPFPSTCLERSLALWWLLARQGIAARLRIGVRIGVRATEQKFSAHAWVECDGIALGEPEAPHVHYAAFQEEFSGDAL